jgi:hypothetical protein
MKHCYKCLTFKLPTEFGNNKSRKDGLSDECKPCKRKQDREYAAKNREVAKKRASEWYYNNYKYALEQRKIIGKTWRLSNRDKNAAKSTRYRSNKLKAMPKWLTEEHHKQIESFYWLAKLQKELTDEKFHVDHIVPLKGKTVCGLHVPWNLQVIPELENIRKGNKIAIS